MITQTTNAFIDSLNVNALQMNGIGDGVISATANSLGKLTGGAVGDVVTQGAGGSVSWAAIPSAPVSSVFGRTGAVTAQANDYSISQVQNSSTLASTVNVNVTGAVSEDYLKFNGTQWINKNGIFYDSVASLQNNYTAVLKSINYLDLGSIVIMPTTVLADVGKRIAVIGAATIRWPSGVFLTDSDNFDMVSTNGGAEFIVIDVNKYDCLAMYGDFVNPFNSKHFTVKNVSDCLDVLITTPVAGNLLTHNGTRWVNSNPVVSSVFGRTGAITAQANDYSISQIQNASTLADSTNVSIIGPVSGQYLAYGTQWNNKTANFYTDIVSQLNTSFTAAFNTIYSAPGCTVTVPNPGLSDIGKRILIMTSALQNVTVTFPVGVQFENIAFYSNFSMISNRGGIELIVSNSAIYSAVACSGNFADPSGKAIKKRTLNDIDDVLLTSPVANQYLKYNGTNWVNTLIYEYARFNSAGNVINNNYIMASGQSATLNDGIVVMSRAGVISYFTVKMSAPSGLGTAYVFTVYINGVATGVVVAVGGTGTASALPFSQPFAAYDEIAILQQTSGAVAPASAYATLEYYST